MLRSLYSGVTGVKGHQTYLDVVGNNIANVNTTGFKKSNVLFQDLLYQNVRGAMSPDAGQGRGGINPMQIGLGSLVGAVETIHTQGTMQYTGNRNDFAVSGDGYFVVKNGADTLYTRAGSATLDSGGNLVMAGSGYMYQGYKMEKDPTDPTKYIEGPLGGINIPVGQKLEARKTQLGGYRCNLDSRVKSHLPMGITGNDSSVKIILGANTYTLNNIAEGGTVGNFLTLTDGTNSVQLGFPAGGPTVDPTSLLPNLTQVSVAGAFTGASYDPSTGKLTVTDGTNTSTVDLASMMDFEVLIVRDSSNNVYRYLTEFNDVAANGYKELVLWGPDASSGNASTRFSLTVPTKNDGTFDLSAAQNILAAAQSPSGNALTVQATTDGLGLVVKDGATTVATLNNRLSSIHTSKMDIYDSLGNPHTLEVSWEKVDNNQWRWRAFLPDETGITLTNNTGVINFDSQGKIEGVSEFDVTINFAALGAEDSTVRLDFSGKSFGKEAIEGVTQYGSAFTTKAYYQDGYPMGVLQDYAVSSDGTVQGVYSNGQRQPLYKMALALFANPQGLTKEGSTVFAESANSGIAQIVKPMEGGAGRIMGSNLEMSNVDLSQEFVNLIVAQRGFQANARVITTSDQVLEELINLKR
ncbi:flagellar hook-basal body protein [Thermanaerovibrio velox DSM 12556]|uniref:Flagellar hook protein FlgE n=1 Tax=Thermanaerovibrio velox DSM 12556 TaxID=926567 RepID=H0UPQ1_9BACT|nr:flagellar hook protein FlgE [Thermanaerovibrio velox]EHM09598.1 flagellar hook-basal body protein [Thermanaerovibrio velox DSM 12556]